jgi:hypothetical protein
MKIALIHRYDNEPDILAVEQHGRSEVYRRATRDDFQILVVVPTKGARRPTTARPWRRSGDCTAPPRHAAGTRYRHDGDFEAAKIVLGHRTDSMTALYAQRDSRKAEQAVSRIG